MAWNPPFVVLLWASTLLDYVAAKRISGTAHVRTRKIWVAISCAGNLGVLIFFKYADFLLSQVWIVVPTSNVYPDWLTSLVLPIGISFYTFQSMSYTIDVYRNNEHRAKNMLDFALYVTFFPQLIAGPILRSSQFMPQLLTRTKIDADHINVGLMYISRGLAKKIILADTLALYADLVFANPADFGAVNTWFAVYAYTLQIYFDFSGYSDIAIGLGRLMGFTIPANFNLPFLSRNPSEFWTRWHISLSTWLRDYLYISLGGSRGPNRLRTYGNLFLTMLLGGIWHGASWGVVIWGTFHGVWLIVHRLMFRDRTLFRVPDIVARISTFHLLCLSFLIFRSESIGKIPPMLSGLVDFGANTYAIPSEVLAAFFVGVISHILGGIKSLQTAWDNLMPEARGIAYAVIIIGVLISSNEAQKFIYFQF